MTDSALKSAYEAVLDLPEEDQAEAAELLQQFVEERRANSLLTPEQQAEVARRLADPNTIWIDQDEVFAEIDELLAER